MMPNYFALEHQHWFIYVSTCAFRESFIIPELPSGQDMVINIKTTWGDKYYVGLNGIELFADNGEPISIAKVGQLKYFTVHIMINHNHVINN